MKKNLVSLTTGILFALGLGLSGMTQPQKVIGFLDIFGAWDPSLIFVMGGAVGFHFFTYKIIRKRKTPLFDVNWHVPANKDISKRLIFGALLFGAGWGLAGYCPGPVLTSLVTGQEQTITFVLAMLSGMFLYNIIYSKSLNILLVFGK